MVFPQLCVSGLSYMVNIKDEEYRVASVANANTTDFHSFIQLTGIHFEYTVDSRYLDLAYLE